MKMKYIRTKNNIYKRLLKDKAVLGCVCDENLNPIGEEIIKESDTIEELIDGYIVEMKEHKHIWFFMETYGFNVSVKKDIKEEIKKYDFYGFIKTDKGLIYVAKVNDMGELELL